MIDRKFVEQFELQGYTVARGLFSQDEVARYRDHYIELRAKGTYPGDTAGVDAQSNDPLKRYPRMIHMHRWDDVSLQWMIDPRLDEWMTALLGLSPFAVQTMLYFKPAGAHAARRSTKTKFYLRVQPGTCMAAWLALDPCDIENGCLEIVPGTHNLPVLCTVKADTTQSFTDVAVPIPEGMEPTPVIMDAGDVMFFNGQLIHGSFPNRSEERFRRSLIGHYIVGDAEKVSQFYHPVLRMDGSEVELGVSEKGSQCGVWVSEEGERVVEMVPVAAPVVAVSE